MTTAQIFMQIDALLLILVSLNCALLRAEDPVYRSPLPALLITAFGIALFLQAMRLLGVWVPGAAGLPWPRLSSDAALFLLSTWRVVQVLRANAETRRRLAEFGGLNRSGSSDAAGRSASHLRQSRG